MSAKGIVAALVAAGGCAAAAFAQDATELWDICGTFGRVTGPVEKVSGGYAADFGGCLLETKASVSPEGVESRLTTLTNTSSVPVAAHCLADRFKLNGGDWEVYTQTSCCQQESRGTWQALHTGVEARNDGVRSCDGAAPMLAVWDRIAGKGRVFHLRTDAQWVLRAVRVPTGGETFTLSVEAGFDSRTLDYRLAPGEAVAFPEVLSYDFLNKTDLDCHKLHAYWNRRAPAREFPAIYNTWLCRFDHLDYDFLLKQVARAKEIGFDYFVVDAGWFGPSDKGWWMVRGDWEETSDGHLKGRLADLSREVRAAGMKFGFWFECEAADQGSKVYAEYPDWFIRMGSGRFLDFRNPAAFSNLLEQVCRQVRKYDASFLKFDFNLRAPYDASGRNFADYNAGYRRFVRAVRERNPGVYLEGCAAGGYLMDLGWAEEFDSFWPTDNESTVHAFRIAKETMLRLPPRQIERFLALCRVNDAQPDYFGDRSRLMTTDDGWWTRLRTVPLAAVDAVTAGGPFAMTCDLTSFSTNDIAHFQSSVAAQKKDAAFWKNAVGRILADTPTVTALQYSDTALTDVRLVVVPHRPQADRCTIRPAVDPAAQYLVGKENRPGADLAANGLEVRIANDEPKIILIRRMK